MSEFKIPTEIIELPSKGLLYPEDSELAKGTVEMKYMTARVLGYGKDYTFDYSGESYTIDLSTLDNKPIHSEIESRKTNEFAYTLPHSGNHVTFRLLTHKDEQNINRELEGLKKINKDSSSDLTTRLKHIITSVEGNHEKKDIRDFVDNYLLAKDSRALREYIKEVQPDVDMSFFPSDGGDRVNIPIGVSFFWPDI